MSAFRRASSITSALFSISLGLGVAAIPSVSDAHQFQSTGSPHCGPSGAACPISGQVRLWRSGLTGPWIPGSYVTEQAQGLCRPEWPHCRYGTTFCLTGTGGPNTAAQNVAVRMDSNHLNESFETPQTQSFSSQCGPPPTEYTAGLVGGSADGRNKGDQCPSCGNPVNPANGNKYQRDIDYRGAGSQALVFERSYNSFSLESGDIGVGWQHNYSRSVRADYGVPAAYSPNSASQSKSYLSAEDACEQGWLLIRNRQPGLATTTAEFDGTSCNLKEGTTIIGQAPIYNSSYVPPANPPLQALDVVQPDGKSVRFAASGGAFVPPSDVTVKLEAVSGGYQLTDSNDNVELYNSSGQLTSITSRNGYTQTLTYVAGQLTEVIDSYGRKLTFGYTGNRITSVTDPDNKQFTYAYNGDRLETVTGPDGKYRTYLYADANFPNALTGIRDEAHVSGMPDFAHWTYDTMGRVSMSEHAAGLDGRHTFTYSVNAQGDRVTTVTDGLSADRTYQFQLINGAQKIRKITQPCLPSCSTSTSETLYDGNGFVDKTIDFNGNTTDYTFDSIGLERSRIEAFGTSVVRTITTDWETAFRLPKQIDEFGHLNEPLRRTVYTYDPVTGDRLTRTVTDLNTSDSRTTTWTYTTFGRVETINGPRTDVNDVTTYAYYNCATGGQCGQVQTITNALGQVTSFNSYDAHGNPLSIVDPNGVSTVLSYDLRQRLGTRTVNGAMTSFEYDGVGNVDKATLPGGSFLDYVYDNARRLTDILDNSGNKIHYTLDAMGNRTKEEVRDPGANLTRSRPQVFNILSRLEQVKNAAGTVVTEYAYDPQGNRTSQKDYSTPTTSHLTQFEPDALNRIWKTIDAASGPIENGFNALDQVTSVKDQKFLTTGYTVNALGDVKQLNSPDTGNTVNTYDAAGNLKTRTDARGVLATYSYDKLNRLTSLVYGSGSVEDVTYTYDGTNYTGSELYGKGRLTGVTDQGGTTKLFYDARGNLTQESRTISSITYVTNYGYDSADRLTSITYPTGRIVTYVRNTIGQVAQVTTTLSGVTTTVADSITYMPFGAVKGYTLGNGVAVTRHQDTDGRIDEIKDQGAALMQNVIPYYDLRGNIDATADLLTGSRSQTFTYDALSRLKTAEGLYGLRGYNYEGVGDRLYEQLTPPGGSMTQDTYTYPSNSHKLQTAGSTSFTYDSAGNATAKGSLGLTYNNTGRASSVGSVGNTYNAAGQRIKKTVGGQTTVFHYDRQGHLLAEKVTPDTGLSREYVWLEDLPLALAPSPYQEAIVDNSNGASCFLSCTEPRFSVTGNWSSSTAASGYYGGDYSAHSEVAYDRDDLTGTKTGSWATITSAQAYAGSYQKSSQTGEPTFNWSYAPPAGTGDYRVYARWANNACASSDVGYDVTSTNGMSTYTRNQTVGSGQWDLLGTHFFNASGGAQITVSMERRSGIGCIIADGVRFEAASPSDYAQWAAPVAATYEVFVRWPASSAHTSSAEYRVTHSGGTSTFYRNQKTGGGAWNSLGTFTFTNATSQGVKLMASGSGVAAADAVKFTPTVLNELFYYHNDHLGTPQKLTNAGQQVVWDASYKPFGEATLLTSAVTQPLRFPGQYFDAETGLHQNWNRDYDPSIGRYLQSDPIGLKGGLSTYGYALANPIVLTDPDGLEVGAAYSSVYRGDAGPPPKSTFTTCGECGEEIVKQTRQWCDTMLSTIASPKIRSCLKKRCESGVIRCSTTDLKCASNPLLRGYYRFGLLGFSRTTANVCVTNFPPNSQGYGGLVIHEWAHSCGWPEGGGGGVPDFGNGTNRD